MAKPFRVEISEARRLAETTNTTHQVDGILRQLYAAKEQAPQAAPVDNAIALWSGVDDIQKRIDVTKHEIGALYAKGISDPQNSRATDELKAVVSGTETATDTILAAAEKIDGLIASLCKNTDPAVSEKADAIADAVVEIFEACNFQDITGQRISKVVESLGFIEQRIGCMVDVWRAQELTMPAKKEAKSDKDLLNGPALDGDYGVVDQDDVDALFG